MPKRKNAETPLLPEIERQLRRHSVSIMDIGECLATLGSASNRIGQQVDAASEVGVAIGLRRAAHRIQHQSTERFGEEVEVLAAYDKAIKAGRSHDEIIAFLVPKEGKARTMGE